MFKIQNGKETLSNFIKSKHDIKLHGLDLRMYHHFHVFLKAQTNLNLNIKYKSKCVANSNIEHIFV